MDRHDSHRYIAWTVRIIEWSKSDAQLQLKDSATPWDVFRNGVNPAFCRPIGDWRVMSSVLHLPPLLPKQFLGTYFRLHPWKRDHKKYSHWWRNEHVNHVTLRTLFFNYCWFLGMPQLRQVDSPVLRGSGPLSRIQSREWTGLWDFCQIQQQTSLLSYDEWKTNRKSMCIQDIKVVCLWVCLPWLAD